MNQHQRANGTSGVGLTAITAAAARAVESSRPARLIDDPLATALVAAANPATPLPVRWPDRDAALSDREILLLHGAGYVGLRARFGDDELRRACVAGVGQVVLLAAGLDSRAFRIDWPDGVRLFEIDLPSMLEFKNEVLRKQGPLARCARTAVGVDLREDWAPALANAGFDADSPRSGWPKDCCNTCPQTRNGHCSSESMTCPRSAVTLWWNAPSTSLPWSTPTTANDCERSANAPASPWTNSSTCRPRPNPAAWLAGRGWAVTEHPVATIAERYRREGKNS
jgi:hypothetical protein